MVDITVIIPSKNEEKNIDACLKSVVGWAKKVIVVDSNSQDKTIDIVKKHNAEIITFNYTGGWPKKRQFMLDNYEFNTTWVVFLDADEILTDRVKEEISKAITSSEYDGYFLFYRMEFLGKLIKYADPGMWKLALFKVGKGNFEIRYENQDISMGDMEIHEHIIIDGKVGKINEPILHRNINSLSRFIIKHDEYSNYECKVHTEGVNNNIKENFFGSRLERRRYLKNRFIRNPIAPIGYFLYLYFIKGGVLDGMPGFYYITYCCINLYFINSKIYEVEKVINDHV